MPAEKARDKEHGRGMRSMGQMKMVKSRQAGKARNNTSEVFSANRAPGARAGDKRSDWMNRESRCPYCRIWRHETAVRR